MPQAATTPSVRLLVADILTGLGAANGEELRESILVRDGVYCGRRFEQSGWGAIWLAEVNQIKFYDPAGRFARLLDVEMANGNIRRAA
jgi:hypothetical protein